MACLARSVLLILLRLDPVVDFFPVNGNIPRRVYTDPDLVSLDTEYRDGNFITDHQRFTHSSRKN